MNTDDLCTHVVQFLSGVGRPVSIVGVQRVEKADGSEPYTVVVEVRDPHGPASDPNQLFMIKFWEIG